MRRIKKGREGGPSGLSSILIIFKLVLPFLKPTGELASIWSWHKTFCLGNLESRIQDYMGLGMDRINESDDALISLMYPKTRASLFGSTTNP